MAQDLERALRQTDDEAVAGELRRIGERLAKHLPSAQLKVRYFLVDLSVPQALSISGGRIYVSRKMAAFVHNEDEMAGVIGHEMGHMVTHQAAVDMTALLKGVLGVMSVSDRRDVFDKYNRLQENWRRNPQAFRALAKKDEGK